jgi:hypothetical protein
MENQAQLIPFEGIVATQDDKYILSGNGISFSIPVENTKYIDSKLHLKVDSVVELIEGEAKVKALNGDCNCPPSIRPTGREERIPKFGCETTCVVLVMLCNYCVYNPAGGYLRSETKVCGACVGLPF